ncbi:MAG: DciA family protein [Pseudomonadota bacterium]|nr:DciA family protein [Pseudomonadota bacterium]MDP1905124.1 DciA family protein [Pseudomonadota bacterium]MDP2351980.1 DciA family protein [Pseudomonadota bacterium]
MPALHPYPMAFRPSSLQRIHGILRGNPTLAIALPEAERLRELNRRFAGVVPAAVARACRVAAIQGDTALVFCANGAAASRVRSQATGVARVLTRPDAPVLAVKVKVRAEWTLPEKREKADLGPAALNAFRDLDAELPDGDLKMAVDALLARRRD